MSKKSEYTLCLLTDGCYVCEIVNQSNRGFLINATGRQFEYQFPLEKIENELKQITKKFKIKRILLSSSFYEYQLLRLYYLKESSQKKAAELEYNNLMYGTATPTVHEYNVKFFEETNPLHISAFYIHNDNFANLLNIFNKCHLQSAEIIIAPPLFVRTLETFSTQISFVGVQIDRQAMTLVARSEDSFFTQIVSLPIENLIIKLSEITQSEITLQAAIKYMNIENSSDIDQKIVAILHEFVQNIYKQIAQFEAKYFPENNAEKIIVGGELAGLKFFKNFFENNSRVEYFLQFFRKQIAPKIDERIISQLEPFLPSLLVLFGNKKEKFTYIKFDQDAEYNLKSTGNVFSFRNLLAISCFTFSIIFYLHQTFNRQKILSEFAHKDAENQKQYLEQLSSEIKSLYSKIEESKKEISTATKGTIQRESLSVFFNDLQRIFAESKNTYLSSLKFHPQSLSASKCQQVQQKNSSKHVASVTDNIQCEIAIEGYVFVEDTEKAVQLDGEYPAIFNDIFMKIKNLDICKDIRNIKVNPPENYKLFFRCIIDVEPNSPVVAL